MNISAIHIANLFSYASYQGVSEDSLRTHLETNDLNVCNTENSVTVSEFLTIYKTLLQKSNNRYFGLYYGCFLNIKALGFINQISLNATDITQAILILQAYLNASFPIIKLIHHTNNSTYSIELKCTIKDESLNSPILDTVFCFIYRELKLMLHPKSDVTVFLPYPKTKEYSKLLDTDIEKGEKHLIQIHNVTLQSEIYTENNTAIAILLPKFISLLNKKDYEGFSLQMRNMILNMCTPEIPTFNQVAKQFPYSTRTIQRKLTKENNSFRKISNGIKKELSYYLIQGKQMKNKDIAFYLGYADTSAYLHALKNWMGNKNN